MLRLNIVDFTENLNSQLMHLTRFKILEFKRLFPLLCSTRLWGQPGEISLFVFFCFVFWTHEQFTNAINKGSACSVLFLSMTGLFPAHRIMFL